MFLWSLLYFFTYVLLVSTLDDYILKPVNETWIDETTCSTEAVIFSPLQNTTFAVLQGQYYGRKTKKPTNYTRRSVQAESYQSLELCAVAVNEEGRVMKDVVISHYIRNMIVIPQIMGTFENLANLPANFEILDIGLGCGTLRNYWTRRNPSPIVTSIEYDPAMAYIAKTWFSANETNNSKVIVADGVEFVKANKKQYDVIFVDACTNRPDADLICPEPSFLEDNVTIKFRDNLKPAGSIVINVCTLKIQGREILFNKVKTTFEKQFKLCAYFKSPVYFPSNKILGCTNGQLSPQGLKNEYIFRDYFFKNKNLTLITDSTSNVTDAY